MPLDKVFIAIIHVLRVSLELNETGEKRSRLKFKTALHKHLIWKIALCLLDNIQTDKMCIHLLPSCHYLRINICPIPKFLPDY